MIIKFYKTLSHSLFPIYIYISAQFSIWWLLEYAKRKQWGLHRLKLTTVLSFLNMNRSIYNWN